MAENVGQSCTSQRKSDRRTHKRCTHTCIERLGINLLNQLFPSTLDTASCGRLYDDRKSRVSRDLCATSLTSFALNVRLWMICNHLISTCEAERTTDIPFTTCSRLRQDKGLSYTRRNNSNETVCSHDTVIRQHSDIEVQTLPI